MGDFNRATLPTLTTHQPTCYNGCQQWERIRGHSILCTCGECSKFFNGIVERRQKMGYETPNEGTKLEQASQSRTAVGTEWPSSVKDRVTKHLNQAHQSLMEAHMTAMTANPLAADVPVFQKMQGLAKDLSALMLEVNRLRGL